MLDFFRLPRDGFHYRRLVEAFKRVFGATIFFGTEAQSDTKAVIDWARFHFLDHMKLWYSTGSQCSDSQTELQENMITLSEVSTTKLTAIGSRLNARLSHHWLTRRASSISISGSPGRVGP